MDHSWESYDPCWAIFDPELRTRMTEALSKIRSMYDSRRPLFIKENIRDACQLLKEADEKKQEKISVKALDGAMADLYLQSGETIYFDTDDPEVEHILHKPYVGLISGHHVIVPFILEPPLVYCNLDIAYKQARRNKSTGELLITPTRPYEEVEKHFKTSQEAWKASGACKELESSLLSAKTSSEITKIVAFACGPITAFDQRRAERSLFQHALLLAVRDVLNAKNGTVDGITCYVQDPAYTDVDKQVFEQSGIIVLDPPEAFLEVDDSTVVLSFGSDAPVRGIVADIARPAMMIWDDIKDELWDYYPDVYGPIKIDGQWSSRADPISPRLRGMVREMYDELGFPGDMEHFGKLAVYIRRNSYIINRLE